MDEVFAKFLCRHSMFISEDLPTLLRPMNAYSFFVSLGQVLTVGELITYSDDLMSMLLLLCIGVCIYAVIVLHFIFLSLQALLIAPPIFPFLFPAGFELQYIC